jgi:hypothetical protein
MTKTFGAFTFLFSASLIVACDDSKLSSGPMDGGQGGMLIGTGGAATGGSAGAGAGGQVSTGGSMATATGGSQGTGGRTGLGAGTGGRGVGTGGTSGAGGTGCPPIFCQGAACAGELTPNPDPCGCPICNPPDAGAGKDGAADAECMPPPCPIPSQCPVGTVLYTPPCGCPTCVPVDAGAPDAIICPPVACPAITCMGGTLPNLDPCSCPICAPLDAAPEAEQLSCVDLDECSCLEANGCSVLSAACWCPFPQCGSNGACVCGGGKFIGCVPLNYATCEEAKARVASLCPQMNGVTWDGLCDQADSACIIKCLDQVDSCTDVHCTFCDTCGCFTDRFGTCVEQCKSSLTGG